MAFSLRSLARRWSCASLIALLVSGVATAQEGIESPNMPREFQGPEYRLDNSVLRFCLYSESAILEFEKRVAAMLADALLQRPQIVEVDPPIAIKGLDIIPISVDDLFRRLSNDCDGFLGVELIPEVYPPWMTVSAPYISRPYVLVTRRGGTGSLSELPPAAGVATQSLTSGDVAFGAYISGYPKGERPRRRPYPTSLLQLQRLRDGTEEAALIWLPWLDREDMSDLMRMDAGALALPERPLGIALRARDSYLRQMLDQAITQLSETGAFEQLYRDTYPLAE